MFPVNPEEVPCGIAETTALLRRVDDCVAAVMQRVGMPPQFGQDGCFLTGELSGLEGQLHRHLVATREAIRRSERNEHIVDADQAKIDGERAHDEYDHARDAIHDEIEQHRTNEQGILERINAIRIAFEQVRTWQSLRLPIGHPTDRARRQWFPIASYPPWPQAAARRELDDFFGNINGQQHPWPRPPRV